MTARLVHVEWMRRNGAGWDKVPASVKARTIEQTPEATDPGTRHPVWWQMAWSCFCDTSTERSLGFGVGPIPWSKIVEWGTLAGLTGSTLKDLVFIVRRMDAKWLELERIAAEAERKAAGHGR
jgi:hypothetical protein